MNTLMAGINTVGANIWKAIVACVLSFYSKMNEKYLAFLSKRNINASLELIYALLIALIVLVVLVVVICIVVSLNKKRKVYFYYGKKLIKKTKTKCHKKILFPEDEDLKKDGEVFVGWFRDKDLTKPFLLDVLEKHKDLRLYAKYDKIDGVTVIENSSLEGYSLLGEEKLSDTKIVEEQIDLSHEALGVGDFYDLIRYEMLSYERATPFKNLGVVRKQVVAEMFEKDGKINLYFAVDPDLMKEKGYNVERYSDVEFQIVPCKKIVETYEDYEEALKLIKEAMLINNFVKSDVVLVNKTKSDENIRKSGFAFFVKNDVIATTASEYYILLRAVVLSYKLSALKKYPESLDNKMILKIFKKDERIFLYLALNAEKEGLEFVGYDKNFADTPAMFEIKSAEDCAKAQSLIDKLMFYYGMEKYPEQAEISLNETLQTNCGFGYRIRR